MNKMAGLKIDLCDRFDKPLRSVKYKCSNACRALCNNAFDFNLEDLAEGNNFKQTSHFRDHLNKMGYLNEGFRKKKS